MPTAETTPTADHKRLAETLKILGDPTRLAIIRAIAGAPEGRIHVGALSEIVGASQPAVSHHLALLKMVGMIEPERRGRENHYSLVRGPITGVIDGLGAILAA